MGSLPGAWVKMRRSSTGRLGAEELGRMGSRCLLLARMKRRFQETLRILNTLRSPIGCGSSILPKGHTHDSFLFPSLTTPIGFTTFILSEWCPYRVHDYSLHISNSCTTHASGTGMASVSYFISFTVLTFLSIVTYSQCVYIYTHDFFAS